MSKNKDYDRESLNLDFAGIVQDITYSKAAPTVKVNDKWYDLDIYGNLLGEYLNIGDSLVKEKRKAEFVVYRKNASNEYEIKVFKYELRDP